MNCAIGRIIHFREAMVYKKITIRNDKDEDITQSCKFSWSSDNVCWTNWSDYQTYLRICKNISTDFYLRILFYDSLKDVFLNNVCTDCYNISLDDSNIFLKDFCQDPNLFQPYNNLDCALLLQQQLADSIVCMFGIPVFYFKVDPKIESLDYTFKEYVLHNVSSVKQIKLMLQDGQLPSSNYRLTEFDFDWETDWETELSKTQFATAFGDTVIPNRNDFIYIPMMKRMWQVNAAYDEKNEGLMWRSTTWKLSLVKYNDSTNVDAGDFSNIIDNLIENDYIRDIFDIDSEEQHREVGADPISAPGFASTNKYDIRMSDAVRKECSNFGVNIIDQITCQNNQIIGRNIYNLDIDAIVAYQKRICGESGTIMFILYNNAYYNEPTDILKFGNINITASNEGLIYNGKIYNIDKGSIYLVACRWDKKTYTTNINIYKQEPKPNIPVYKLTPEMYSFNFKEPIVSDVNIYNEDFEHKKPMPCEICGPCSLTNIKYYNDYLSETDVMKESMKYVTTHDNCVINDLARPIISGYGYEVK